MYSTEKSGFRSDGEEDVQDPFKHSIVERVLDGDIRQTCTGERTSHDTLRHAMGVSHNVREIFPDLFAVDAEVTNDELSSWS